jgi:AhpD family alkylhydroperoxidase
MTTRVDAHAAAPAAIAALLGLELAAARLTLEPRLLLLARLRTSQLNRCTWCVDLDHDDALRGGERIARLDQLAAWRGSTLYTPRERAALAWAEFVARPKNGAEAAAAVAVAAAVFDGVELAELTLALCTAQAWNRLGIGYRRLLY